MPLSMYQVAIPPLLRALNNLSAILDKTLRNAESRHFDAAVLLQARLAPDMFPFIRQVQIVTDTAKGCGARLAGVEVPSYPDTETSFDELQQRLAKTISFLQGLSPAQFDGSEARDIVMKFPNQTLNFTGQDYLQYFVLPNFYFHLTTAYDILRHNGVPLGKADYLGGGG
ncbi:DUF1993 domain-containing protein [Vogesella indigofera]|uniref:DUF1993 domain-containing protein n=1 Tax=Vogesella indigofera TaxID=45465 RepID=UPI00234F3036|nr:DUF1993 domain-containing protein [Vogesella indigofera]MDC7710982.1 DUF1993 domain-containing protein [Vogesella indigofera]